MKNGKTSSSVVILKSVTAKMVKSQKGKWNKYTEHVPISIRMECKAAGARAEREAQIPKRQRQNPRVRQAASMPYGEWLPKLTEGMDERQNEKEL